MKERRIKLTATEEVQEFVRAAGKCDFDIDLWDQRIVIDAKSLLGVLGLGLSKVLTVQYCGEDINFEYVVGKYAIA